MRRYMLAGSLGLTVFCGTASAELALSRFSVADCDPETRSISGKKIVNKLLEGIGDLVDSSDLASGKAFDPASALITSLGGCAESTCSPKEIAYQTLLNRVSDLLEDEQRDLRGLHFRWVGAGAEPPRKPMSSRIRALFDPNFNNYAIACDTVPKKQEEVADGAAKSSPFDDVRVAVDLDNARKPKLSERDVAYVSYRADRAADEDVVTVKATVLFPSFYTSDSEHTQIAAYLSYDRETSEDRSKETNDLTLGMLADFYLGTHTLAVTGSYVTDDRFDSAMWKADLIFSPGISWKGYRRLSGISRQDTFSTQYTWSLDLKMDYAEVNDAGRKTALASVPQYARAGFDIEGALRFGEGPKQPAWYLKGSYAFRSDFSGHDADADLFTAKLEYLPEDTGNFAFGVEYQHGENIDTLDPVDEFKITFGYRR